MNKGKIIENYQLQAELGTGVYSSVFKAINMKNKQEVAIKVVKVDKFKELPKLEEGTVNQINILTNLEPNPHIIRYYDMLKTVNNFYFVYEYCNGGTLEQLLKKPGSFNQKTSLFYFAQIIEAFKVLNKNNIMHRDLKPENLLLHNGILKLADFGFCKPLENQNDTARTMLGSPLYMAPEILKGDNYTIKADIWSLGVVLYRMLFGQCPFQSKNIGQLIMVIDSKDLRIPQYPEISTKVTRLLKRMIVKDPNLRADWNEVFAFQIKNGEIVSCPEYSQKQSGELGLKNSFTNSESATHHTSNFSYSSKDLMMKKIKANDSNEPSLQSSINHRRRETMLNHKETKQRKNYASKSPARDNMKKDMLLKNHAKCAEILSFAIKLAQHENVYGLFLSYVIIRSVQKQLHGLMESVSKQTEMKNEQSFFKQFQGSLKEQEAELRRSLREYEEELRYQCTTVKEVEERKKQHMKKFIGELQLESLEELVMASRLIDFLEDNILIRKETYEKMSREQLQRQIKQKLIHIDG